MHAHFGRTRAASSKANHCSCTQCCVPLAPDRSEPSCAHRFGVSRSPYCCPPVPWLCATHVHLQLRCMCMCMFDTSSVVHTFPGLRPTMHCTAHLTPRRNTACTDVLHHRPAGWPNSAITAPLQGRHISSPLRVSMSTLALSHAGACSTIDQD
jgi:hypothetical protein